MKDLCFFLVAAFTLIVLCSPAYVAQEVAPLESEWLAKDYESLKPIQLLASPAPLTVVGIKDLLGENVGVTEKDLGFGGSTFSVRKGSGYTSLEVEGFHYRGSIAFYKITLQASSESWPRIREQIIELWKLNHGPDFNETETGLVHSQTMDEVVQKYKSSVSVELGAVKQAEVPRPLKDSFEYLTSPMNNHGVGDRQGEMAITALVNEERIDLIENVLRGLNPSGRIYAARTLLRLSKDHQLTLSPETISTIEKVRNLNVTIHRISGCIVSYATPSELLDELEP